MKRFKTDRTNIAILRTCNIRNKINNIIVSNSQFKISHLEGILFGLLASNVITFYTYERFNKLIKKIENNQIISLRK